MIERWPCGHPKNFLNTRSVGDGKTTCARCRSVIDKRYTDKKREAKRECD